MKAGASLELTRDGYTVFVEPPFAPSMFLEWSSYRPDILGIRRRSAKEEYALVECETKPSKRRLDSKNFRSVEVQSRIDYESSSLRRILVVPRGTLRMLEPSVRFLWEMWIFEGGRTFQQFPVANTVPPALG